MFVHRMGTVHLERSEVQKTLKKSILLEQILRNPSCWRSIFGLNKGSFKRIFRRKKTKQTDRTTESESVKSVVSNLEGPQRGVGVEGPVAPGGTWRSGEAGRNGPKRPEPSQRRSSFCYNKNTDMPKSRPRNNIKPQINPILCQGQTSSFNMTFVKVLVSLLFTACSCFFFCLASLHVLRVVS